MGHRTPFNLVFQLHRLPLCRPVALHVHFLETSRPEHFGLPRIDLGLLSSYRSSVTNHPRPLIRPDPSASLPLGLEGVRGHLAGWSIEMGKWNVRSSQA